MATLSQKADIPVPSTAQARDAVPPSSLKFDYAVIAACAVFIGGLFLDSWAHTHLASTLETFFTPWHAVMYGGFALVMVVHSVAFWRNINRGYAFTRAMPPGYMLSMIGIAMFALGGVGDMFWHEIFGIEINLEATVSPSHLLLMVGGRAFGSGPLRSMWAQTGVARTWKNMFPALASAALTAAGPLVLTQYFNLLVNPVLVAGRFPRGGGEDLAALGGVIVPSLILMAPILLVIRRWRTLPFGAMTLMVALPIGMMSLARWRDVVHFPGVFAAVVTGGLLADVLLRVLRPSEQRPNVYRLFGFLMPAVLFAVTLLSIRLTHGLRWSPHMGLGAPVIAGLIGLTLALLALPPHIPAEPAEAEPTA